jgi:predicted RNase H-like HicB family nuclease
MGLGGQGPWTGAQLYLWPERPGSRSSPASAYGGTPPVPLSDAPVGQARGEVARKTQKLKAEIEADQDNQVAEIRAERQKQIRHRQAKPLIGAERGAGEPGVGGRGGESEGTARSQVQFRDSSGCICPSHGTAGRFSALYCLASLASRVVKVKLTAVFEKVPEGHIGFVEELPGANTQGTTLDEARANLAEAVELVLEANRALSEETIRGREVIREPLLPSAA